MGAPEKISEVTRRLKQTRDMIDRLPAGAAKDKARAALEAVAVEFAAGVRARMARRK